MSPESTPLPPQHAPVVSYKGTVTCQTQTGDIASFVAAPYEYANAGSRAPSDVWQRCASSWKSYCRSAFSQSRFLFVADSRLTRGTSRVLESRRKWVR